MFAALGAALLLPLLSPGTAYAQPGRPNPFGPLTAPASGPPRDIAWTYLWSQRQRLGLFDADLADSVIRDEYRTEHNDMTHLAFRQRLAGIEVVNGDVLVNLDRDGRVINLHNGFVANLAGVANTRVPQLSPEEALLAAAAHLVLDTEFSPTLLSTGGGPARASVWEAPEIALGEIPAKLMYTAVSPEDVRLTWNLVIRPRERQEWWDLCVDATTGEIVWKSNWVDHATYEVFAAPKESPDDGPRTNEVDPADPAASPLGWHGTPGAETQLYGNNVVARNWDLTYSPDGGGALLFQFPLDLANQEPDEYLDASLTNLFYWNNVLHDVLYQYGFDEAAGNFQADNYGNPDPNDPYDQDAVYASSQDPNGLNNAYFATPPDGSPPSMTHLIWSNATSLVTVNSPPSIVGDYTVGVATFGERLDGVGVTGNLKLADDGVAPVTDGCEFFPPGFFTGWIAVIDRGTCFFVDKVYNAQAAGAIAVMIVNNQGDQPFTMTGINSAITIPSVIIGQTDGGTIVAELPGVNATLRRAGEDIPNRDSALDAGIIAHEYAHGLSNRLVGGPTNTSCLGNQEQMGEGWSDFLALFLTARATDTAAIPRGIGNYPSFQPENAPGIRNYPYTTDMNANPQTYADIASTNIPHGVGEIWASMLWEMYWELVDEYGFDPDLYHGTGGNNLALQLVIDGMKLAPCSPTFVEARNAILQADAVNNGFANLCLIGRAFAKRGLGLSADSGSKYSVTDGSQAFDVGVFCECDDGFDNDGDGRIDFDPVTFADPAFQAGTGDPGCAGPGGASESPECQDGAENDADGLVDFDGGQSIYGACSGTCPPGVSDPDENGIADPDPECLGTPYGVTELPEPSGTLMLLTGAAFLGVLKRRRM